MGMGYALMEEVMIDGGKVVTSNFATARSLDSRYSKVENRHPRISVGNGPYGGMSIVSRLWFHSGGDR